MTNLKGWLTIYYVPLDAVLGRRRRGKVTAWSKGMVGGFASLGVLAIAFLIWWFIWLRKG